MKQVQRLALAFGALWMGSASAAVHLNDHQEDAGELGDTLQYVVPAAALTLTFLLHSADEPAGLDFDSDRLLHLDGSPRHDLILAMARSSLVTLGFKYAVNERRPNGGRHSFPSGHTSFAFTGAEFIRKEYGWWWGIPAYMTASYVGWSRVESKAHYTHDVLAGAAIGILANHDWGEHHTSNGTWSLMPALISQPYDSSASSTGAVHTGFGLQFDWRFE